MAIPVNIRLTKMHRQHFTLASIAGGRYPPGMSVATLQQIGQDFPSWVALVQHGETVVITQAGKIVARLMPPEDVVATTEPASEPVRWPDFAARRRSIFGQQMLPAGTAQALVNEDRGV
jgi:antitoxin (DNA-binding transcriptional repressor) of toxin-antitoxin stability system